MAETVTESTPKIITETPVKFAGLFRLACRWLLTVPLTMAIPSGFAQAPDEIEQLPVNAEEFSLFGEVDAGSDVRDEDERPIRRGRAAAGSSTSDPEFTLLGTTRIGDRYTAILKHRDGSEVVVKAETGRNTRIEGYNQFSVVDVSPGRVSIQYPGSSPCVEFQDKGVSCNSAANIASLELTRGDPIPPVITAREEPVEEVGEVEMVEEDPEESTNPFAALRARALQEGDAPAPSTTPRRSFTPRRIDPADVPPGMRVVSTPFGDRLVRE